MICWHCGNEAAANCKFCGVAVCKKCAGSHRYITGTAHFVKDLFFGGPMEKFDLVIVENAIWCGKCIVKPVFDWGKSEL